MLFKLYNIKLNRYANLDEYICLSIDQHGNVINVWNLSLALLWIVYHGFKHSNGITYYLNDTNTNDYRTVTIGFNGYSFYQIIKSKLTFYDVNYGGLRHHIEKYIISEQTELW